MNARAAPNPMQGRRILGKSPIGSPTHLSQLPCKFPTKARKEAPSRHPLQLRLPTVGHAIVAQHMAQVALEPQGAKDERESMSQVVMQARQYSTSTVVGRKNDSRIEHCFAAHKTIHTLCRPCTSSTIKFSLRLLARILTSRTAAGPQGDNGQSWPRGLPAGSALYHAG